MQQEPDRLFNCCICLNDHTISQKTPCGHEFCRNCFARNFLETSERCPICRKDIPNDQNECTFTINKIPPNASIDNLNKDFSKVCAQGKISIVQEFLSRGVDLNATDAVGLCGLIEAADAKRLDVVKLLIDNGVTINQTSRDGKTALYIASFYGHSEIVKFLLQRGADFSLAAGDGCSALYVAAQNDHLEVVKSLIESGADLNQRNAALMTPLMNSSGNGHLEVVKYLIQKGANINLVNQQDRARFY